MSLNSFMQGFLQGTQAFGGPQAFISEVKKDYFPDSYNVMEDPRAMQQYQMAAQGTPAMREKFIDEYGQYYDFPQQTTTEQLKPANLPDTRVGQANVAQTLSDSERMQYMFGEQAVQQPTIYGLGEGDFVQSLLSIAGQGGQIPGELTSKVQEEFGYDIQPLLQAVSPQTEGPSYNDFVEAYMGAKEADSPYMQEMFMQQYGDFIPEGMATEGLFPEDKTQITAGDLREEGFVHLPEERAENLRNEGYIITPAQQYYADAPAGLYEVQEPYIESQEESSTWRGMAMPEAINYIESRAEAGYNDVPQLVDEFNTAFDQSFTPEEFTVLRPSAEGNYLAELGSPLEAAKAVLEDDVLTEQEMADWETAGYQGAPNDYWQPEEDTGIGISPNRLYGTLDGQKIYKTMEGTLVSEDGSFVEPEQVPNIQRATAPESTEGDAFTPEAGDIAGTTPEGKTVYGTSRRGYYTLDEEDNAIPYTGEVVTGRQTSGEEETTTDEWFDWSRYAGMTEDRRPVMRTTEGGLLTIGPEGQREQYFGEVIAPAGEEEPEEENPFGEIDDRLRDYGNRFSEGASAPFLAESMDIPKEQALNVIKNYAYNQAINDAKWTWTQSYMDNYQSTEKMQQEREEYLKRKRQDLKNNIDQVVNEYIPDWQLGNWLGEFETEQPEITWNNELYPDNVDNKLLNEAQNAYMTLKETNPNKSIAENRESLINYYSGSNFDNTTEEAEQIVDMMITQEKEKEYNPQSNTNNNSEVNLDIDDFSLITPERFSNREEWQNMNMPLLQGTPVDESETRSLWEIIQNILQ